MLTNHTLLRTGSTVTLLRKARPFFPILGGKTVGTIPAKKQKYSNMAAVLRKAVKMLYQVIRSIFNGVPINMISVLM